MCLWNRIVTTASIALVSLPIVAQAVPVSYSFTGELTAFGSDDGVTQRTLESLSSRSITGRLSYDTERQDTSDISGVLRIAISGPGFFYDAGYLGIGGSQAIYRNDSATLDGLSFFESYEYMLPESLVTRTTSLELYGSDLLNPGIGPPNSMLDTLRFEYGSGSFWATSWDYDQSVTGLNGVFDITSLSREGTEVPEPGSFALLGTGLLLLAFANRRHGRRLTDRPGQLRIQRMIHG